MNKRLGPIVFAPPQKVPAVQARDTQAYVTFTFHYRSKGELQAHLHINDSTFPELIPAIPSC